MEFDVLELYKIYAESPENFVKVLRNIFAYETEHLFDRTMEVAEYINGEEKIDHWRYMADELEKLETDFMTPIVFLKFFRKVNMNEFMSADELISNFRYFGETVKMVRSDGWEGVNSIREKINAEKLSKEEVKMKFKELREDIFEHMEGLMLRILDVDEKI